MPKLRNKNKQEEVVEDNVEPALKTIEFRQRRGEKLNYLIKRNIEQKDEEDEFWNNNAYFNQGNLQSEDESYEQRDNEKNDSFDSDFQDTSSSSENQQEQEEEDKSHKSTAKKHASDTQQAKRKYINQAKTLYIHDIFKQEQLLREAVLTELSNKISLQYLIQIEEDKKKIKNEKSTLSPGPTIKTISNKNGTTIQFLNYDEEEQLFPKSVVPQTKQKKYKYKDPQTQQKFNTIKEYKQIKRINKLQDKINSLTKLLNS